MIPKISMKVTVVSSGTGSSKTFLLKGARKVWLMTG